MKERLAVSGQIPTNERPANENQGVKRRRSALLIAAAACAAAFASAAWSQSPHTHHHSFEDAHKWAQVFDDPKRDAWQKPHEVIQALALPPDAVVADIGAGTGYFAVRLAHMVPKGRVFAVDTEPAMVKHLAERAKQNSLPNLTAVAGKLDDPRLPEKADLVLLVDVYHHVGERDRYFRKVAESLKPSGRVAIRSTRLCRTSTSSCSSANPAEYPPRG
jgi:cyclopropane fatty-acyl-phospholipid synthase-like methyltransferase